MSVKFLLKTTAVLALFCLALWPVAANPNHMNMYALDARSKPELRTSCGICHYARGREDDPAFLTAFGKAFKAAGNRLTPELRDEYTDLFLPRDAPVGGVVTETYSVTTEQVLINVTVRNGKGRYVSGLGIGDFSLLEDGREQKIQEFYGEDTPLAVAVLLDASGSALENDLERAGKTILDFANRLRPSDKMAIFTFGAGGVQQIRDFSSQVGDLKPLLKKIEGKGFSPLYDAIIQATEELRYRPERRRAIILLSDGADETSQATQREAERRAFEAGVSVYAIDLVNTERDARRIPARQAGAAILRQIATETGGRYITAEGGPWWAWWRSSRGKLKKVFEDLIDQLHKQYTIAYDPTNDRKAGRWRTIRVKMVDEEFSAATRLGYRESIQ